MYRGSHVNPSDNDPRGGSVTFCVIPNFCHPSARGTGVDGPPVEYARLWVHEDPSTWRHGHDKGSAVVVLTRGQVQELRDTFTAWLERDNRAWKHERITEYDGDGRG